MSSNPSTLSLPPRRRRFGWLRTLIVYFAGLVTGVAVCLIFIVHRVEYAIHHPENAPPRITQYLTRKLDLSPAQHDQVLTILKRRQLDLQSLRREMQPKLNAQLDLLKQQIDGVLTPDQQSKWATLLADARERWLPDPPPATQAVEKP